MWTVINIADFKGIVSFSCRIPDLNFDSARFPIYGGLLQRRAGTARHDAVAWGYARAADAR